MNRLKMHSTLFLFLCFLVLPVQSYGISKENKIYKNIYVENIDISNLTKQEAVDKVMGIVYREQEINFIYNKTSYPLSFRDIELSYDIDEVIDKACNVGESDSLIKNAKTKLSLNMGNKISFKLQPKYNQNEINKYILNLENRLKIEPVNANIDINNNDIKISNETNGSELDTEKMKNIINNKIDNRNFEEEEIPTKIIIPKYTTDKLSKINTILGTYETKFNSSNYNRSNNIFLATDMTNNILLDTQEEFSFNEITGKRNTQQGFKEAPIIINGELKKGIGGGICQVSSTLYNAALYSGLEITQARNHSIPSAYIQKGRDATVAYGAVDLKFKNIYEYPILVKNKIENNKIVSTIYGNDSYKKNIDIVTEVIDVIPYKVIVKKSNAMYEGEKFIKEKGRKGYRVKTYRVYKNENGEISNKELINESYYPPMNKTIIKGTKYKNDGLIV